MILVLAIMAALTIFVFVYAILYDFREGREIEELERLFKRSNDGE